MPSAETAATTKRDLRQLHFRVAATRARLLLTRTGTGLATAAAILIGGFAVEMTLDWLIHLPWVARACFSLPAIGGAGWIFCTEVFLPLLRMPSDHAVACTIERAMPVFQTRLIASIQLGRETGRKKSALVGALIRETAAMAAGVDFRNAVRTEKLIHALRLLACVTVAAAGLALLGWWAEANTKLLIERALLMTVQLPSWTRIETIDCPLKIAAGDDLKIDVHAGGVIPEQGLIIAQSGSRKSEYKLERDPAGGGLFHAVIQSVPESFSFTVRLNDATSDPVTVAVYSPPVVVGVATVEQYPAYTGLPPAEQAAGDLSLLAGSTLQVTVTASEPVKRGTIHLAGLEKDLPLTIDTANQKEAHGEIPIPEAGLTGFSVHVADNNGIASRESALYPIDIVPDTPPTIKLTHPDPEEVATADATEVIAFQAEDDFGVAAVFLHYVVNHTAEKVIEFDLGGENPREMERRFDWTLGSLKLAPGAVIEYWMEAMDANNVTGPGKGMTDKAEITIVTDDEKRAELTERMNDALGSLDGMSQSEDALSKQLGTRIFQKPEVKPP